MVKLIFFNYPSVSIMIYLPGQLSHIMGESHACGLKTRISRIKDNQLTPDLQSGRKNNIHFYFTEMFQKSGWCWPRVLTVSQNVKIVVEVLKGCRNIFVHFRQSSEVFGKSRKYSEVAGIFSEIWVMTRRKSHAFDSEKVGRYIMRFQLHTQNVDH